MPEANSSFFAKPKRSVGALDRAQGAVVRLQNESQDTSFAGLVSYSPLARILIRVGEPRVVELMREPAAARWQEFVC